MTSQADRDRERYRTDPEYRERRKAIARAQYHQRKNDPEYQERSRQWRARNAERRRERERLRYQENREAIRARRSTDEAKAQAAEYARQWRKRNPGKAYAGSAREYTTILRNDPCSYCGAPTEEIDHIVPISKAGSREWDNLTAACLPCNRSKKDRPLLAWMLRRAA